MTTIADPLPLENDCMRALAFVKVIVPAAAFPLNALSKLFACVLPLASRTTTFETVPGKDEATKAKGLPDVPEPEK